MEEPGGALAPPSVTLSCTRPLVDAYKSLPILRLSRINSNLGAYRRGFVLWYARNTHAAIEQKSKPYYNSDMPAAPMDRLVRQWGRYYTHTPTHP